MNNITYITNAPQPGRLSFYPWSVCFWVPFHMQAEKPWKLGRSVNGFTLSEGQEWHRDDFTPEMLPEGTRPRLKGEGNPQDFQCLHHSFGAQWGNFYGDGYLQDESEFFFRTRRPLSDPYAELKAAHAAGKTIEVYYKAHDFWQKVDKPVWSEPPDHYRIVPTLEDWIPHNGEKCPVAPNTQVYFNQSGKISYVDTIVTEAASRLPWSTIKFYRLAKTNEKKYRPWTRETCPRLPFEVVNENGGRVSVLGAFEADAYVLCEDVPWAELLRDFKQLDGTPCGEEIK